MTPRDFQRFRKALGKSQSEVAKALGISIRTVQSYEQGLRSVPARIEQLVYLLLSRQAQTNRGRSRPCWELRQCDPAVRSRCPAYLCKAGDICWLITGTLCQGKHVARLEEKLGKCRRCPVIRQWRMR